jgi:hypothetical protein
MLYHCTSVKALRNILVPRYKNVQRGIRDNMYFLTDRVIYTVATGIKINVHSRHTTHIPRILRQDKYEQLFYEARPLTPKNWLKISTENPTYNQHIMVLIIKFEIGTFDGRRSKKSVKGWTGRQLKKLTGKNIEE